jgi:hypothetical protein
MSPKKVTEKPAKSAAAKTSTGWTDEERAAMRERAREMKAEASSAAGESDLLAKIEIPEPDRALAKRSMRSSASAGPLAEPRYGMPAYAKDGKVVCFFHPRRSSNRCHPSA